MEGLARDLFQFFCCCYFLEEALFESPARFYSEPLAKFTTSWTSRLCSVATRHPRYNSSRLSASLESFRLHLDNRCPQPAMQNVRLLRRQNKGTAYWSLTPIPALKTRLHHASACPPSTPLFSLCHGTTRCPTATTQINSHCSRPLLPLPPTTRMYCGRMGDRTDGPPSRACPSWEPH